MNTIDTSHDILGIARQRHDALLAQGHAERLARTARGRTRGRRRFAPGRPRSRSRRTTPLGSDRLCAA